MISEFDDMPRLKRWTDNVKKACEVSVDGTRLSAEEALSLLNPDDPLHELTFEKIAPHLPEHVLADFRMVRTMSEKDRIVELESTINRLRAVLESPLIRAMNPDPSVDTFLGFNPLRVKEELLKQQQEATDLTSLIWQPQTRLVFGDQGEDADILGNKLAARQHKREGFIDGDGI